MSIPIPAILQTIPNPPTQLFSTGLDIQEILARPRIAIVGSRKISPYGKSVTQKLARELAKQGIVIVSGLALGVDALAHTAALEAGGLTVAVLPTGLDKIYPSSHRQLARQITKQGLLLTEYPSGTTISYKGNFVARNRLVSGLSDAVLITEATINSGTLHTARFAQEQGRKVFAVPGNITSPTSAGTNHLIQNGATLAIHTQDLLRAFGIAISYTQNIIQVENENEQIILDLLYKGIHNGDDIFQQSGLSASLFNQSLTMLEINGHIRPLGANMWTLAQ